MSALHTQENERLAAWLKAQRERQGLTMRELAAKMALPHSFIGKVEQRERRLDVIEYLHYCRALGVSPVEGLLAVDRSLSKNLKGP